MRTTTVMIEKTKMKETVNRMTKQNKMLNSMPSLGPLSYTHPS